MRAVDGPDTPEQPFIAGPPRVCCVDLDGSLVAADLFWEAAVRLVFERPWLAPMLPLWLCRGIAHLKRQVAQRLLGRSQHAAILILVRKSGGAAVGDIELEDRETTWVE